VSEHPVITRVEVYKDHGKEFRFRAFAANGLIIASSSESYRNHLDALNAARAIFPDAHFYDQSKEPLDD
jgi:uncharacterized protein YegP (UPF0339 family)